MQIFSQQSIFFCIQKHIFLSIPVLIIELIASNFHTCHRFRERYNFRTIEDEHSNFN